ncbi:hypothetical protein NL676_014431 [Syzygium grande]|nr:hypothetical protein NL676_014431 [Syzygium grande]
MPSDYAGASMQTPFRELLSLVKGVVKTVPALHGQLQKIESTLRAIDPKENREEKKRGEEEKKKKKKGRIFAPRGPRLADSTSYRNARITRLSGRLATLFGFGGIPGSLFSSH